MLMIHFGILPKEFETFNNMMVRVSDEHDRLYPIPIAGTDAWNSWGSIPDDPNDPIHVTFTTMKPMEDLNFLGVHFTHFLIPMEAKMMNDELEGLRLALTDVDDFSEEYVEFRW